MEVNVNPYGLFIEVLSDSRTPARLAALTGEMIAMHAELNQLFGRTKGKLDREAWTRCADEYARQFELCGSAWKAFAVDVDPEDSGDSRAGENVMETFLHAVVKTRVILEEMRRENGDPGKSSWI